VASQAADGGLCAAIIADLEEVRIGDARVGGDGENPAGRVASTAEAAVEFEGEHQAGELGLPVGLHGRVTAVVLEVGEADGAAFVGDRGNGDDSGILLAGGGCRSLERGQEEGGEGEVTEDIGAELQLKAVSGFEASRWGHYAGVVDEEVERDAPGEFALGKDANAGQRCEVQLAEAYGGLRDGLPDTSDGGLSPGCIAGGDNNVRSAAGEFERGGEADAAVGTGDDCPAACLVGHVCLGPLVAHTGVRCCPVAQ